MKARLVSLTLSVALAAALAPLATAGTPLTAKADQTAARVVPNARISWGIPSGVEQPNPRISFGSPNGAKQANPHIGWDIPSRVEQPNPTINIRIRGN